MKNLFVGNSVFTGYVLVFIAALLWGVSGTCAQFLFQDKGLTPEWLVSVRQLLAGITLLTLAFLKHKTSIFVIFKNKKNFLSLLVFSILGMLAVQYSYLVAIQLSNAATATVLQYLGPVFIATYYTFIERRLPAKNEFLAIGFAILGTFLVVTHGSLKSLSLSGICRRSRSRGSPCLLVNLFL